MEHEKSSSLVALAHCKSSLGLVVHAARFAAQKHRTQRRKDREASPYINHPLALADILVNEANVTDPVVVAAALLHDTVEDTDTSYEELEREFGKEVAGIVMEVTDDKTLSKAERKALQVANAGHKSAKAKLIKLADKISNLRDIVASPPHHWGVQRKCEYFDWARDVVAGCRGINGSLEQVFDDAYSEGVDRLRK